MKFLSIVLILLTVFLYSCQNDVKVDKEDSAIVIQDTVINEPSTIVENEAIENKIQKKQEIKKEEKKKEEKKKKGDIVVVSDNNKKVIKENKYSNEGGINMREETAEDLEKEVNVKVARVANPDNDNENFEIKEDASLIVVPVLTAEDKAKYYVQFKIKVSKISKSDLSRFFPDTQKIYVVQHQGLYKYCVGQFDNEEDAKVYKKMVDKEFGFKSSEVATYSDAW